MEQFERFFKTIIRLRDPEKGCPWDIKQSALSMRSSLIEEAYECVEAINKKDDEHTKEELGDLMLVAFMISYIKEQEGKFSVSDVLETITDKLIRRHPHVFGDASADTAEKVIEQWDDIKQNVEGRRKKDSLMDDIKDYFPPLKQAVSIQKKAAKAGFDWKNVLDIFDKLDEEKNELIEEIYSQDRDSIENEIGDLLFSVVNIARFMKIDPGIALHRTNTKFKERFRFVEKEIKNRGLELNHKNIDEMENLWNKAKDL